MSRVFRLKMARQEAEAFLKREGITTLPVDPFAIANKLDIEVKGKPADTEGVSGMLLRHGNTFGIVYATNIPSKGFQRFSVSHELGHFLLPGHPEQVIQNDIHISRAGFVTNDPYELEADHFAAGLLMPETPFRKEMQRRDPGLEAVKALATICETSRTATAIRFAELSRDAVAVIVSTGGIIDYCFLSEAMKTLPQLGYLRKGTKLPVGTATASFAAAAARVHAGEQIADAVDVRDWLGGTMRAEVAEETIGLGRYGKILTVLASSSIGQEDEPGDSDDEAEEQVIERWTPRFRK